MYYNPGRLLDAYKYVICVSAWKYCLFGAEGAKTVKNICILGTGCANTIKHICIWDAEGAKTLGDILIWDAQTFNNVSKVKLTNDETRQAKLISYIDVDG